eukprot:359976_1
MGGSMSSGSNRMAIAAMAAATGFDKQELLTMQEQFVVLALREGNPNTITHNEFQEALKLVNICETDTEILDRIFSMLDTHGTGNLFYHDFVVGLAPLISGSTKDVLMFSFELYDLSGTHKIKREDMEKVLSSMNRTAGLFGDPTMNSSDIRALVDDIFKENDVECTGTLSYCEYMDAVCGHPVIVQFLSGLGADRYAVD